MNKNILVHSLYLCRDICSLINIFAHRTKWLCCFSKSYGGGKSVVLESVKYVMQNVQNKVKFYTYESHTQELCELREPVLL